MQQNLVQLLRVDNNTSYLEAVVRAAPDQGLGNDIGVVHDATEALDIIFSWGARWDTSDGGVLIGILLDRSLPFAFAVEMMRQIDVDPRTHRAPVFVLRHEHRRDETADRDDVAVAA
jgi:hypothetical protein